MKPIEIFEKIEAHIALGLGKCATRNEAGHLSCRYRHNGNKCFVGVLIPDEHYRPEFESNGVGQLQVELGSIVGEENIDLLYDLQECHDDHSPTNWAKRIEELKCKYL